MNIKIVSPKPFDIIANEVVVNGVMYTWKESESLKRHYLRFILHTYPSLIYFIPETPTNFQNNDVYEWQIVFKIKIDDYFENTTNLCHIMVLDCSSEGSKEFDKIANQVSDSFDHFARKIPNGCKLASSRILTALKPLSCNKNYKYTDFL